MARPQSQIKQGFHPAPPEALTAILGHLRRPRQPPNLNFKEDDLNVLDPCAGEGQALAQLADGLGLTRRYAIELNALRAARLAEAYPQVTLLGPCSFHATRITYHSFSLIYCNPPFDDELGGGGREETAFVRRAGELLALGGILVLVMPADKLWRNYDLCEFLDTYFEQIEIYLFPSAVRKYGECVLFGRRRKQALPGALHAEAGILTKRDIKYSSFKEDSAPELGQPQYEKWKYGRGIELTRREEIETWLIPYAWSPRRFEKTALTDEEIEVALQDSPLYDRLQLRVASPLKRPPLALGKGHTSLLLLTGLLDGYVASDPPHVVRGYCPKREMLQRVEEHEDAKGQHIEKKVYAEIPDPLVRAVWPDGKIRTFSEKPLKVSSTDEEFTLIEDDEIATSSDE